MCLEPIVQAVLNLLPSSSSSSSSTKEQEFRLVYLGTATYDKEEPFQLQTQAYQSLDNCLVINLKVSDAIDASQIPTTEELRSILLSAHVILVSGGNTLYAIRRWQELGVDAIIQEAVEINDPSPVLCGGSAGAICWFASGHSDSMDPTTFLHADPNLTEEKKKDWKYIRYVTWFVWSLDVGRVDHCIRINVRINISFCIPDCA
jgi:dipeptidase E